MSELNFYKPQRQSAVGILLIFSTAVFQLVRNFWVLGVYFFVQKVDEEVIFYSILGFVVILLLTLVYSVLSYLRFRFYIAEDKGEFVLEKGVFSSEVVSIPYNKIQQVNFKRNLLQRLIGVYSAVIDTAGSKDKEVEIKALTKSQADALGQLLMELARESATTEDQTSQVLETCEVSQPRETSETQEEWSYKLSFMTLLKLGLTSNYFRGLAVLIAFYFSLREQLQFTSELLPSPDLFVMEVASSVILILLLILVGMLITLGETFIKYYNLELKKTSAGLQLEMGLRENTRVTLRAERVQLLQVLTNPLQKKLDLHKLKIALASSGDDLKKDRIQIPGMPEEIVRKVEAYLYYTPVSEGKHLRPHRLVIFRRISRGIIPLIIAALILLFSSYSFRLGWVAAAGVTYLLLLIGFQVLYFRSLKLSVSEDFLIKHSGVWIRKKQIIEMYKLQSVSISQPLWYKRRGLVNIVFHTAGGDIGFMFIDESEAKTLRNYLLFKIEASKKGWM